VTKPRAVIGLGVVGLGVMGRAHVAACRAAAHAGFPVRLAAVCDRNAAKLTGKLEAASNLRRSSDTEGLAFDPREVAVYEDVVRLLADSGVDAVAICTRTPSHVPLAAAALAAGKHVLVEKPLALRAADLAPLVAAADARPDRVVMAAMCMRFWPGWDWLKARVDDRSFGRVRSAVFRRLAAQPSWSRDFYGDPSQSGGALVDLHVHDADFVRHLFGEPRAAAAAGDLDHVTTTYRFDAFGPAHVAAEGGWDHANGFAFQMRYVVNFERATADFDYGREPRLVFAHDGGLEPVPLSDLSGYDGQLRAFVTAVAEGRPSPVALADAARTAHLIDVERLSLESGAVVAV
jgi:predicted dehydrogenase